MAEVQIDFPDVPPSFVSPPPAAPLDRSGCLSDEDFDTLIKSIQLLRISQLRYLVQKFSIPASGNKTKLLGLMVSIFQSLRYEKILVDIYQEINTLISQQEEPFNNPLAFMGHIEPIEPDCDFFPPPTPLYALNLNNPTLGPLGVPSGSSNGTFSFSGAPDRNYVMAFLFKGGSSCTFSAQFELNGFPFEVNGDDPFPQPLEISHVMIPQNKLTIRLMSTSAPIQIIICEYEYYGIQTLIQQICGHPVEQLQSLKVTAGARSCSHSDLFQLSPFLSKSIATGKWNCPICSKPIQATDLQSKEIPLEFHQDTPTQINMGTELWFPADLFKQDTFDWDAF